MTFWRHLEKPKGCQMITFVVRPRRWGVLLEASPHFCMRWHPSVHPSVRPSIGSSVLPSVGPSVLPSLHPSVALSLRPPFAFNAQRRIVGRQALFEKNLVLWYLIGFLNPLLNFCYQRDHDHLEHEIAVIVGGKGKFLNQESFSFACVWTNRRFALQSFSITI